MMAAGRYPCWRYDSTLTSPWRLDSLVLSLFNDNKEKKTKTLEVFSKTAGILKNKKIDPLKWQREIRSDRKI